MQDIFGSVRRSIVFRPAMADDDDGGDDAVTASGSLVEKINSCIRKSRVFSTKPSPPRLPAVKDNALPPPPAIRWRKGELIGCGAFGQVYMGMNLVSGELLAVKQVLIPANHASKEKAQIHVKEIEEEVKLLQNLSHPNIVRYLGTVREEGSLNILLEFVPGGSISSLLGKFGSFPESVIRMYSTQLLLGLDYLHNNGIMHRDIKGANILVDNKGGIKLADFGASKQVVELATVSGAKSMKGTPYWMAPEVIRQTGHSFSADIWSVGCTIIEMATGKPPWSQQYQEVAALFYIGTTKAHPPIPEHLSAEAKDFLLKCLQKEPELRPTARELLQHPFVTGELLQSTPMDDSVNMETPQSRLSTCRENNGVDSLDICNLGTIDGSTINHQKFSESRDIWGTSNGDDDMCQLDDKDDFVVGGEANLRLSANQDDFSKSFNPITEPSYNWRSQNDESPVLAQLKMDLDDGQESNRPAGSSALPGNHDGDFSFSCGPSLSEDDDEVTDSKIRAFLDEKAVELKKLQTPLYEEFFNSLNPSSSHNIFVSGDEDAAKYLKLPPKSRSPSRGPAATPSSAPDAVSHGSPGSGGRRISSAGSGSNQDYQENLSPQLNDLKGLVDTELEPSSPSERQRLWREELDQEIARKREMLRQSSGGAKTSSPKDRAFSRTRSRFASPGK